MTLWAIAYFVEDIEVLNQGITARCDGAIVGIVNGIVEIAQLGACSFNRHHCESESAKLAGGRRESVEQWRQDETMSGRTER